MSTRYMLDTNTVSHIIKGDLPLVRQRLAAVPMHAVAVSAVTEAELRYGVAKRGHPEGLSTRVREFLLRVDSLPWTAEVAAVYGDLRAACEAAGTPLAAMDMMIAAHACEAGMTLVTRNLAFSRIPSGPSLEDWAAEPA